MKNVKNAHFWQVDNTIKRISEEEGILLLPSIKAWTELVWTRKLFEKKPKEGYFVWIKKQIDFPFSSCVSVAKVGVKQDLVNLLVVEEGLKVKANIGCYALKDNLSAKHKALGKIVLKEGSSLEYNHIQEWGQKDLVNPDYQFILKKGSKLVYNYKNLLPPNNLSIKNVVFVEEDAKANINFLLNGLNSKVKIVDQLFLNGENAQGIVKLRIVGQKKSDIEAVSEIVANFKGKGHLDCQGLLVDKDSKILVSPTLNCKHKDAQLTHEASIGRIAEEQLTYLRMRGLSEKEAVNLIISGFLK